jgi:hypothetical protein
MGQACELCGATDGTCDHSVTFAAETTTNHIYDKPLEIEWWFKPTDWLTRKAGIPGCLIGCLGALFILLTVFCLVIATIFALVQWIWNLF